MIRKVLESAIANAENNHGADIDELKVKTIMVDEGPVLKRFTPAPRAAAPASSSAPATSPWSWATGRSRSMGQKVNPIGIRLGITKDWNSKWYAGKKDFAGYLHADLRSARSCARSWPRLGSAHPDRAPGQHRARHDPHRASGRRDRQEGRGHREAAQGSLATLMGVRRTSTSPRSASPSSTPSWWPNRSRSSSSVASCSAAR
jgi:hypothetical protein